MAIFSRKCCQKGPRGASLRNLRLRTLIGRLCRFAHHTREGKCISAKNSVAQGNVDDQSHGEEAIHCWGFPSPWRAHGGVDHAEIAHQGWRLHRSNDQIPSPRSAPQGGEKYDEKPSKGQGALSYGRCERTVGDGSLTVDPGQVSWRLVRVHRRISSATTTASTDYRREAAEIDSTSRKPQT